MRIESWAGVAEWALALAWIARSATTLYHFGDIPNLLDSRYADPSSQEGLSPAAPAAETALQTGQADQDGLALPVPAAPAAKSGTGVERPGSSDLGADFALLGTAAAPPVISVIVPALNEAAAIAQCLRSLLATREVRLEILAVDDRSTDLTGAIMDRIASELSQTSCPHTLRVLHITELPPAWLGKPHALALAAAQAEAPYLLFTDADAFYAPDALARVMRFAEEQQADHAVLMPTPILKSAGERMMVGMMQALAIWPVRLWKVADPGARDSIGVGCFNLLRRSAYERIGGFEALRMEVLEDLRLGYLVKHHGLRQRVALGNGLLCLHWAPGALGIVHGLTKNFFAMCRYRLIDMVGAILGLGTLTLAPFLGLLLPSTRAPSLLILLALLSLYVYNSRRTGISAFYVLLFPVASSLFLYGMIRSTALTLARRGVVWRGTFYALADLRRHAGRLR